MEAESDRSYRTPVARFRERPQKKEQVKNINACSYGSMQLKANTGSSQNRKNILYEMSLT